jgi:hypothetical protein
MTRLILTADASSAGNLKAAGRSDIVIATDLRFVFGPLPAQSELDALLAPRTTQEEGGHWLDHISSKAIDAMDGKHLGLLELCKQCEAVELWMETDPNSQLVLIWLLSYFNSYAKATTNLILRHVDARLGDVDSKQLAKWQFSAVAVTRDHLEIAASAWQAYRSPTPQACLRFARRASRARNRPWRIRDAVA